MRWGLPVGVALVALATPLALGSADAGFGPVGLDRRISHMGPDGSADYGPVESEPPAAAYNSRSNEYLVVWYGDDSTAPVVDDEFEIWAQRLAADGTPLGTRIRVSEQGADGDTATDASHPSVAYNSTADEYLVVWQGRNGSTSELEIWAQRLSGAGAEVESDFAISDMGPDGDPAYAAVEPDVAANPAANEYLVVWEGDDDTPPLVNGELEVFGQRLKADGSETGDNDFRISEQGADGNLGSGVEEASVAYNTGTDEYLVAWEGAVGQTTEFEIWGQRLSAAGAEPPGQSDLRLSDMGPDGNPTYDAMSPSIAANSAAKEYLVVWHGDDNSNGLRESEFEIHGQRVSATGGEVGVNDFQISDMGGPNGNVNYGAIVARAAYDLVADDFLVTWGGNDAEPPLATNEVEIFGQRLTATGAETGANDFRISHAGPDGNAAYVANLSGLAVNPDAGEHLSVWTGDSDVDEEYEVYGHLLGEPAPILTTTVPAGPANENNPRVMGSVDPTSTVDIFRTSNCSGPPAVNDAPGSELTSAGIAVSVPDNTTVQLSATASNGGRTSRCSNSIAYREATPPAPPPPPPPGVDPAPVVSGFVVSPKRFRAGGRSSFRFRLSERATTRILIERSQPGRRVGRRCVAPMRKHRKRARCKRFRRSGTLTFRERPAGQNRIAFPGRIGRRPLARADHRATITATDSAGQRSVPRRANFRIARR